ncbi:D-serine deaminase-like pyridoxal phosphate-dependent protein [Variovorax boronicumulans]|uniref:alanine racemase n=1 Tax=Variovorax boronicumulans TaxID=436515 RepID=UPI002789130A|nr:alanine racemase [Variovorax boronicumulans]MDQ0070347.1 D-serine deaminase-like pyridoxal phosphate-dependent protein [Variovorax boronicumulans]
MTPLAELTTPALLLDVGVLERNCEAMAERAARHGVALRPHLKTAKSAEVARRATRGQGGGLTVSTVAEAAYFARRGFTDLTYAVGIDANKIEALHGIQRASGARITLLADRIDAVQAANSRARVLGATFRVLLEIDTGGGRGGVGPNDDELLSLAHEVQRSESLSLAGVLTHAGHSYHVQGGTAIRAVAEAERAGAVQAAGRLRAAGMPVDVVSVGSTPTAVCAQTLEGVTEMRPGVYTFFDLDQAARGICGVEDIALSVLATVIGHNPRSRRVLIDAGALALSKDQSAAEFRSGLGFGLVCHAGGTVPLPGLCVAELHQEHGLIACDGDGDGDDDGVQAMFRALPVGSRVRVLPHHACMTAAPYDRYHVVEGAGSGVQAVWDKACGWQAGA